MRHPYCVTCGPRPWLGDGRSDYQCDNCGRAIDSWMADTYSPEAPGSNDKSLRR